MERVKRPFWMDKCPENDGFSTAGVAIALLVTLSLVFTGAQVYRVQSAAADTQEVADAAALAGDNIVAEYYPGIHSRIYLRGLSDEALNRVIKKYEQKTRKKLIMR